MHGGRPRPRREVPARGGRRARRPAGGPAPVISLQAGGGPEPAAGTAPPEVTEPLEAASGDGPEDAGPATTTPETDDVGHEAEASGAAAPDAETAEPEAAATSAEASSPPRSAAELTGAETAPSTVAAEAEPAAASPETTPGEADGAQAETSMDSAPPAAEVPGNAAAEPGAAEMSAHAASEAGPGGAPALGDLPSEQDDGNEAPSGGGGGGGAVNEQPEPEAPAIAPDADPASAMASTAELGPAQMQTAMGAVGSAVGHTVGADRNDLAANPPSATPPAAPPGGPVVETADPGAPPTPQIAALPETSAAVSAAASAPAQLSSAPLPNVPTPHVTANAEGQITAADAQSVQQSVAELPTTDPALNVDAGPAPQLALDGAADPNRAAQQRSNVAAATQAQAEAGVLDAAQPMGEGHIVPTTPPEMVRAELPAASGGTAAVPAAAPVDPTVAIVARQRSADELRAAATSGSQQLAAQRTEQQGRMTETRATSQRDMDAQIATETHAQGAEGTRARSEVRRSRSEWTDAQRQTVEQGQRESDDQVSGAQREAATQQTSAQTEAQRNITDGNAQVATARTDAETRARTERDRAQSESSGGGLLSRIGSAIGSFFDGIKNAIHAAFQAARNFVKSAIAAAQRLAAAAIDRARNAIVSAIRRAGEALIAIGDRVLGAFPGLRDRFRAAIHRLVEAAVAGVNKIADRLKAGIKALLDLLGRALTALLDAYEALYMAAVNAVASAVRSAINAANAIVQAVGAFAQLIRDVAANPGQWIRNLGAALMDGVRNHLWTALKAAIKEWFNSKVEAVVGVGRIIFDVLRRGGIPFRRIGAMVWVAVKAAIPRAIIEFLIQRVISMLIPAAAAIMAIVEGLQAAWATASRVIAAFEQFMAFLRAVKGGNAGPQFARALAAAAVAVIDFTANFIISKIAKGAKGVGGRLKGIATRIMAWLRRGANATGRVLRRVGRVAMRAVRAIGGGIRRAGQAIANSKLGRYIGNSRLGRFVGHHVERTRARFRQLREKRRQNRAANQQRRLETAVAGIRPPLRSLLNRGVGRLVLWGRLAAWRIQYWLSSLKVVNNVVVAKVNPDKVVDPIQEEDLGRILTGVFEVVEAALIAKLITGQSDRRDAVFEASEALAGRGKLDPGRFAGMSRLEQSVALRTGAAPGALVLEPGVTGLAMLPNRPQNIVINVGAPAYFDAENANRGIVPGLVRASRRVGLDENVTAGLIISDRPTINQFVTDHEQTRPLGPRQRRFAAGSEQMYNRIRRASLLQSSLENARRRGMIVPHQVAGSLAFSKHMSLTDMFSGSPMSHRLAASGNDAHPEVIAARATTMRKVYRIMAALRAVAEGRKLVVSPTGFNLGALGEAVRRFLLAHIENDLPRLIDEFEIVLTVELASFLERANRR
jgi:hypothetical protein